MSMWKNIKQLWQGDTNIQKSYKEWKKQDAEIGWNVYTAGKKEKVKELGKRIYVVHVILKGRIIRPLLWLVKRYTKKHYKGVPPGEYNKNLHIFEKSYDKTIHEWHQKVLRTAYNNPIRRSEEYWNEIERTGPSGDLLRTAKEAALLIALTDTAYRNFLDMLMYNIYKEMHEEYQGKTPQHLIYTSSDVADADYYHLHSCLKTGQRRVYRVGDTTCCEYQAIKDAAELIAADAHGEFMEKVNEAEREGKRLGDQAEKVIAAIQQLEKEKFIQAELQKSRSEPRQEQASSETQPPHQQEQTTEEQTLPSKKSLRQQAKK